MGERPECYCYLDLLRTHLGGDLSRVFSGELIYPRQVEVQLPGDGVDPCNFYCSHCQGRMMDQGLGQWEETGLRLVEKLGGAVGFYQQGGQYTEPLMNAWVDDYLRVTKRVGSNFGVHTNGAYLLEHYEVLAGVANSPWDYVTVSLDAGNAKSHSRGKRVGKEWFGRIIEGIRALVRERGGKPYPVVRVCYLMNKFNSSEEEIASIVASMKEIGVDSLRFSVPYAIYNQHFDVVRKYRDGYEVPFGKWCAARVAPFLSVGVDERPWIFWLPPEHQDVRRMTYHECIYSYYQITLGADGWFYRCTSTATPTFAPARLGRITDDVAEFREMVKANQSPEWDAHTCFEMGARCNRIALEINSGWAGRDEA